MPAPLLSIVIPAYNEQTRLPGTLALVGAFLERGGLDAEVIVVDDGSADETAHAARQVREGWSGFAEPGRFRVVSNRENRGKGYSTRRGILEARGNWVLFSDADLSTPIEDFDKLYEEATKGGYEIVIGSRALPESNVEIYQPFYRRFMGQTFNRIVRLMTGLKFHDTQCGFKLMVRERVRPLVERMVIDRFAFDVELLYLAVRAGLTVAEVPVTWRNSPMSRVGLIGDPLNMLRDISRVVRRFRRGGYREPSKEEYR
jgi:dolichyl-phosphate beta-glucosyltransferase